MTRFTLLLLTVITISSCKAQTNINDMKEFEKITWEELNDNAIRMIGHDWFLIGSGSIENGYNMMTASWGNIGWLWQKPVSIIYVRPQRYTHEYTEKEDFYTITFYKEEYKEILRLMGTVSGRDFDKINDSGLTAIETENGSVGFKEAYLILECKKLYCDVIKKENFYDPELSESIYPSKDFHTMYIGEIVNVWRKKNIK